MFRAHHNSQELFYRAPFGAVTCGQKIRFRLRTFGDAPAESCVLRLWAEDREELIPLRQAAPQEMNGFPDEPALEEAAVLDPAAREDVFEGEYITPGTAGLIWYYFMIRVGRRTFYYGNSFQKLGGVGSLWPHEPPAYQITVYKKMEIPEWYTRGTMYQIFVDRFFNPRKNQFSGLAKKNMLFHTDWYDPPVYIKDEKGRVTDWDFFGGNLEGVIEKIPFFKALGVNILYFNPIFEAASNHKYDTGDYLRIDPMYGDETVFKRLLEETGQAGISVILDGVFSHTGSDSIYFNRNGTYPGVGAYQSQDSPYFEWYKFNVYRDDYVSWWGVDTLPEVNEMNSSYRQFIFGGPDSVVQKWLKLGVAGWRLDVADELPDEFLQGLREGIKSARPDAVIIGEVWEDASNKISYEKLREYLLGDELDATMNYPFRTVFLRFLLGQSDAQALHREIMGLYENYPRENFYAAMNLIGTHDTMRILTILGGAPAAESLTQGEQRYYQLPVEARALAVRRLKLMSLIQMTFPGVPCVYYGDEAGVEGYADPYNRGTYPWGREDREIQDWYGRILRFRAEYETLLTGDFTAFHVGSDVYGFRRAGGGEEVIVLLNRHITEAKTVDLDTLIEDLSNSFLKSPAERFSFAFDLISGEKIAPEVFGELQVGPLEARVLFRSGRAGGRKFERSCGVLLHISSLPSAWGSGDFGKEAYDFVDFLAGSGQSLWQVLPLNPAGMEGCPYQSDSVFAGNPEFISLDHLIEEGLLDGEEAKRKRELLEETDQTADHGALNKAYRELKEELLREAYGRFRERIESRTDRFGEPDQTAGSVFCSKESYLDFQKTHQEWLPDFALFRALKAHFEDAFWYDWERELAFRQPEKLAEYGTLLREEIEYNQFLQYVFFYEWAELKKFAGDKGILIIGDMPHFVAADSCDVWINPGQFALDAQGKPAKVSGVPPDYFSNTGQLWGNPVYDWEVMAADGYAWWRKRIEMSLTLFDYIRLDHFRGFEAFWTVDAGDETAEKGWWLKGPGKRFFEEMEDVFGPCPFIVEDLGFITPEVNVLKRIFGYPGIKVLQFTPLRAASEDKTEAFVYYSGTHDNSTLLSWYEENARVETEKRAEEKDQNQNESVDDGNEGSGQNEDFTDDDGAPDNEDEDQDLDSGQACRKLMAKLYESQADWIILPMQDILGLGDEARMNVPGTVYGNWQWQLTKDQVTEETKMWLRGLAERGKRLTVR